MLDFLATLLKAGPTIASLLGGKTAPYLDEQKAAAAKQAQLTDALTNTQNPIYANLFNQYNQQGDQNIASVLAQAQGQNRMASSLGRTPLLSQERGGEQLFRSLIQGKQDVSNNAMNQARTSIGQAMSGQSGLQNTYNNVASSDKALTGGHNAGYAGIADLISPQAQQQPNYFAPQQDNSSMFDFFAKMMKSQGSQESSIFPAIRGNGNGF